MAVPLTVAQRSKGSALDEPLSLPPMPHTPLLLTYGCTPLLVCLLGWLASGCFDKLHLLPVPAIDSATPLFRTASSTVPC